MIRWLIVVSVLALSGCDCGGAAVIVDDAGHGGGSSAAGGGDAGGGGAAAGGQGGGSIDSCGGMVCAMAPANACANSQQLRTYAPSGRCDDGRCLYDSQLVSCPQGCASGACIGDPCLGVSCASPPASQCRDAFTLKSFVSSGTCTNGACTYAASDTTCQFGCQQGACLNDPCAGKSCAQPPATYCADANTLRSFASAGQCAGGSCTYAVTNTTCPFGCTQGACVNDPCAGLSCTTPPATYCVDSVTRRSFSAAGVCTQGSCTYAPADATCTYGCAQGSCQSNPCANVTCNAAPAPTCVNASTARTYASGGSCTGGSCSYSYVDQPCPQGCAAGRCAAPSCNGLTCNQPPAATCTSASVLRTYAPVGSCSNNQCAYQAINVTCGEGCFNGACIAGGWSTESVPSSLPQRNGIFEPQGAIDAAGQAHLVGTLNDVFYRFRSASGWAEETVDVGLGYNAPAAIAIENNGTPVFAYFDAVNLDLRFARRTGPSTFTKELIATAGDTGRGPSIAVSTTGEIAVSFYDSTARMVKVARRGASAWVIEDAISFTDGSLSAPRTEIAYGSNGSLHVVAGNSKSLAEPTGAYTQPAVRYAVRQGATWAATTVNGSGMLFRRSLSFDELGQPVVFYGVVRRVGQQDELRLMQNPGANQRDELIMLYNLAGYIPTMALYAPGTELKVASTDGSAQARRGPSQWWPLTQPSALSSFADVRMAPDRTPRFLSWETVGTPAPCVASCTGKTCGSDGCGGTCGTCATGSACSPQGACTGYRYQTIDLAPGMTAPASSGPTLAHAVNAAGDAHLAYAYSEGWRVNGYNYSRVLVQYLVEASGQTKLETPYDNSTSLGYPVTLGRQSLALDGASAPTIAYSTKDSGALTKQAGAWSTTLLPNPWSYTIDLAVEAGGTRHAVYRDYNVSLTYARSVAGAAFTGTSIATVTPPSGGSAVVGASSLAVDSAAHAHVVWDSRTSAVNSAALNYSTNLSGAWVTTPLLSGAADLSRAKATVAVDPAGTVHIVYRDEAQNKLVYRAKAAGAAWSTQLLPLEALAGFAVTTSGVPVVATVGATGYLKLSRRSGAMNWSTVELGVAPVSAEGVGLGLDGTGRAVISVWERSPVSSVLLRRVRQL